MRLTGRPSIAWKSIGVAGLPIAITRWSVPVALAVRDGQAVADAGGARGLAVEHGVEHLLGVADLAVGGQQVHQLGDGFGLGLGLAAGS